MNFIAHTILAMHTDFAAKASFSIRPLLPAAGNQFEGIDPPELTGERRAAAGYS
jgi:hypothetical protein